MRFVLILAICFFAGGCGPRDEPRGAVKEPVDLFWYAQERSDDFVRIPGFRTMADCNQAGASMTRLIKEERISSCEIAAGLAGVKEGEGDQPGCDDIVGLRKPWYECGVRCRPWDAKRSVARCKTTEEHR